MASSSAFADDASLCLVNSDSLEEGAWLALLLAPRAAVHVQPEREFR
jgi:hypothetical protein